MCYSFGLRASAFALDLYLSAGLGLLQNSSKLARLVYLTLVCIRWTVRTNMSLNQSLFLSSSHTMHALNSLPDLEVMVPRLLFTWLYTGGAHPPPVPAPLRVLYLGYLSLTSPHLSLS